MNEIGPIVETADCSLCRTPLAVYPCRHGVISDVQALTSREVWDENVDAVTRLRNIEALLEDEAEATSDQVRDLLA